MATVEAETAKARRSESRVTNATRSKRAFLRAVADGNTVAGAARIAGRTRQTVYRWRDADERFAQRWDEAVEARKDAVAQEVWRRGLGGSDNLLMFYAKRLDPAFRDSHSLEINHSGTIEHEHKVVSASAVLHILQDAEGFDGFEAPGLAGPGGALPSTRELLAAHPDTEAGSVPPASTS